MDERDIHDRHGPSTRRSRRSPTSPKACSPLPDRGCPRHLDDCALCADVYATPWRRSAGCSAPCRARPMPADIAGRIDAALAAEALSGLHRRRDGRRLRATAVSPCRVTRSRRMFHVKHRPRIRRTAPPVAPRRPPAPAARAVRRRGRRAGSRRRLRSWHRRGAALGWASCSCRPLGDDSRERPPTAAASAPERGDARYSDSRLGEPGRRSSSHRAGGRTGTRQSRRRARQQSDSDSGPRAPSRPGAPLATAAVDGARLRRSRPPAAPTPAARRRRRAPTRARTPISWSCRTRPTPRASQAYVVDASCVEQRLAGPGKVLLTPTLDLSPRYDAPPGAMHGARPVCPDTPGMQAP